MKAHVRQRDYGEQQPAGQSDHEEREGADLVRLDGREDGCSKEKVEKGGVGGTDGIGNITVNRLWGNSGPVSFTFTLLLM